MFPKQEEVVTAAGCPILPFIGNNSRLLRAPHSIISRMASLSPSPQNPATPGARPSSHLPHLVPGLRRSCSSPSALTDLQYLTYQGQPFLKFRGNHAVLHKDVVPLEARNSTII